MGERTAIEWTNKTWNPWVGCIKVSQGCKNCYMYRDQTKYGNDPRLIRRTSDATFKAPLKWRDPAMVFTCSWSDWFIEEADEWRPEAWEIVKATPHLTYQILTKRPERIRRIANSLPDDWGDGYPNVWLGVSVEDSSNYDRLLHLKKIPAKVRFISAEPLLGPVSFLPVYDDYHWLIIGGESGPNHRPMNPEWASWLAYEAKECGVPVFFKQMGGNRKIGGHWGGNELYGHVIQEFPVTAPTGQMELPL